MSLSTLLSLPVFSRVVMARVAMLLLESVMRFSRSRLQAVTADGCFMATCKECNSKIMWEHWMQSELRAFACSVLNKF